MVVSDQLFGVVTFIDGIDEGLHDEALIGSVLFLRGVGDHVFFPHPRRLVGLSKGHFVCLSTLRGQSHH